MLENIVIKGARENNLKNVSITLPRNKLIVFTGLSGSGKSSLAFETIYAEGQRRYVESLSSYARQFLGQMEKPDVDSIDGLSPAIAIDQKSTSNNPRSTVGTVTEIYDYLRLMFARIGTPHCPECGRAITRQSIDQVVDQVMKLGNDVRIQVIAPVVRSKKGEHVKLLEQIKKEGYVRVKVDGVVYDINDVPPLSKTVRHTIDVVIDRLKIRQGIEGRLSESLETAFDFCNGIAKVDVIDGEELTFSQKYACPECGISVEDLAPRMFSFNNPYGACPECMGLGVLMRMDPAIIISDDSLSINKGAINVTGWRSASSDGIARVYLVALSEKYGFSLDTPWRELSDTAKDVILYGTHGEKLDITYTREFGSSEFQASFSGIIPNLERRYKETNSDTMKAEYESYMSTTPCPVCGGKRLNRISSAVTVGGRSIIEVSDMAVLDAMQYINSLQLSESETMISAQIVKEISARLGFLLDVGLEYLTLSRPAWTLSGGEAQRIRLATQIGAGLVGVLYILDEPSIGLHQRDNAKLLATLEHMRDVGNTLIVVEHDEETMRSADYIVDIGPGAGEHGGEIVAQGTPKQIEENEASITGQYLSGRRRIEIPQERRAIGERFVTVLGASANNLQHIDVKIPLGVFTCVTGVSGSGKSSLVNEVIKKTMLSKLNRAKCKPGPCDEILGLEYLDKIIDIDQSPIGRTPRSNPATYTGLFDLIRELFALTPEAKLRGYTNSRFSFNVKGGRCETCHGDGIIKIEMHFLPDVYVPCEVCHGNRYNRETLEVRFKGKNIADVLDMRVEEALSFFENQPKIVRKLQTLFDVGLGYIKLGQSSTTLSGGEAQRVKLATELSRRDTGKTFYVLDEPTTGLHVADVQKLLDIINRLCNNGSTVLVIEHNLDVIKTADYIIDLGPEGGDKGGNIVAQGRPEDIISCDESYTGQYLKRILQQK